MATVTAIPFGKHRGRPLAEVPTDYLLWLLRVCKLSTGVRAAVTEELARRGQPAPDAPVKALPSCRRCGHADLQTRWQEMSNGARALRAECRACGSFVGFLPTCASASASSGRGRPSGKPARCRPGSTALSNGGDYSIAADAIPRLTNHGK